MRLAATVAAGPNVLARRGKRPNGPSPTGAFATTIGTMTNPEVRMAWQDVADRLEALALKLKLHAEEELSGDGGTVKAGLDRLRVVVDDAVTAVGDACRDPAVRSDVRDAMDAFGRALSKTIDGR